MSSAVVILAAPSVHRTLDARFSLGAEDTRGAMYSGITATAAEPNMLPGAQAIYHHVKHRVTLNAALAQSTAYQLRPCQHARPREAAPP
jgi:hypothetical protein